MQAASKIQPQGIHLEGVSRVRQSRISARNKAGFPMLLWPRRTSHDYIWCRLCAETEAPGPAAPLLVPLQLGLRGWHWGREGFLGQPETGARGNIRWCEVTKREGRERKLLSRLLLFLLCSCAWFSLGGGFAPQGIRGKLSRGMLLARHSATSPTLHTTAPPSRECPTLTVRRSEVPRLRNPAPEPWQREGQCEAVPAKATSLSSCCPITNKALTVRLRNVGGGLAKGPGIRRKNDTGLDPSCLGSLASGTSASNQVHCPLPMGQPV